MLQAITDDGYLHWRCLMFDPLDGELISCGEMKKCHIDEAVYREVPGVSKPGQGAMIDLPACTCGARTSLKADYTIRELWYETVVFVNERGEPQVYALPLQHVRNLHLHQLLYEQGRAAYPPVIAMPAPEVLNHPMFAEVRSPEGVAALWMGFSVARQRGILAITAKETLPMLASGE